MSGIISDNLGRASGLMKAAGGGKIGQVVSTNKTDTTSAANISSLADISGFTVAITPVATSSKILILIDVKMGANTGYFAALALFRDTTQIHLGDAASSRFRCSWGMINEVSGTRDQFQAGLHFLDSPSTTSEIVYKTQWKTEAAGGAGLYLNYTQTDVDSSVHPRTASTITAMEILA